MIYRVKVFAMVIATVAMLTTQTCADTPLGIAKDVTSKAVTFPVSGTANPDDSSFLGLQKDKTSCSNCTANCQCGCNSGAECTCDVRLAVAKKQQQINDAAKRADDNLSIVSISSGDVPVQLTRVEGYIGLPPSAANSRYISSGRMLSHSGMMGGSMCGPGGCGPSPMMQPMVMARPMMIQPMMRQPMMAAPRMPMMGGFSGGMGMARASAGGC